jgi:hypothetical protein
MISKRLTTEQLSRLELFKRMMPDFGRSLDGSDFVIIMDYVMTGVLNSKALSWEWELTA